MNFWCIENVDILKVPFYFRDLQIRVEPEGMTLNVPVLGIMPTPPSELSQPFEKTGHSKSQESNESQVTHVFSMRNVE